MPITARSSGQPNPVPKRNAGAAERFLVRAIEASSNAIVVTASPRPYVRRSSPVVLVPRQRETRRHELTQTARFKDKIKVKAKPSDSREGSGCRVFTHEIRIEIEHRRRRVDIDTLNVHTLAGILS